jgi:cytochrome c-type biogenesis protein CcmH/NrfG
VIEPAAVLILGAQSYGDRLLDAVKDPLTAFLTWLVYALLIVAAISVVLVIRHAWRYLPPRRGTVVALGDLGANARERQAASHMLSRQLLAEITALSSGADGAGGQIDESRDLDRSFVANLRIAGEGVERLDSLMEGETAVAVGPLSFNARQLAYFFGTFFRRRSEYELVGSLTPAREGVVLTVERQGPGAALDRWQVPRTGEHATSEAIRDVAMQIVVGLGCSTATSDWRSFRDYRTALDLLDTAGDADDPHEQLERARLLLGRALDRDPLNPLARFYLGTAERKLGNNEGAVEQFRLLQSLISGERSGRRLKHFVDDVHPEFRLVVRYNLAASLLKLDKNKAQREALTILNSLHDRLVKKGSLSLTSQGRYRFEVLVESALAWALTFRIERVLDDRDPQAKSKNGRELELLAEIKKLRNTIHQATPQSGDDAAVYANALATAENAYGRAFDLLGRKPNAVEAYRRATTLLPDFVDAHLNLAEALIDLREFGWQEQAEAAIRQALRSEPSSRRAEYLYGRLSADPSVARYEEAKQHFERAGGYSQALFLYATLLAQQDGKLPDALAVLDRAIAANPAAGHRLLAYANFVLQLAGEGRADRARLNRAREYAERLAAEGYTPRFRRRGQELVEQIDATLTRLETEPTPDAAAAAS